MIEFAIAASAFFLILLGIIDFALTIFDVNAGAAGVREGTHSAGDYIGTNTTAPISCDGLSSTTFVHIPAHTGPEAEDDNEALRIICRTKIRMLTAGGGRSRVQIRFEDADGNPAPDGGLVVNPGQYTFIVICAQFQARSITGAFAPIMERITLMTRSRERLQFTNVVDGDFHIPAGGETFFDTTKVC